MEEELKGFVVDIACLRKYRSSQVVEKAREHTRECLLMGHCIESGYGLVSQSGGVRLLDPLATPKIVSLIAQSGAEKGNILIVSRSYDDEKGMCTREVRLAN